METTKYNGSIKQLQIIKASLKAGLTLYGKPWNKELLKDTKEWSDLFGIEMPKESYCMSGLAWGVGDYTVFEKLTATEHFMRSAGCVGCEYYEEMLGNAGLTDCYTFDMKGNGVDGPSSIYEKGVIHNGIVMYFFDAYFSIIEIDINYKQAKEILKKLLTDKKLAKKAMSMC